MEAIYLLTIIAVLTPLFGAFASLLLKKWQMIRDVFGVLTIGISAIMSIAVFIMFEEPGSLDFWWFNFIWPSNLSVGFYLDGLSVMMLLIVSILSMLIAFFSLEYMGGDKYKDRYWFFMQLFVSGMLLLVVAHDMVLLFAGWEIVGLCSCFLIAHHFMKEGEEGKKPALSGIKALIMTGIGDIGLLVFLAWLFYQTNSLLIPRTEINGSNAVMSIFLILAPLSKSAQFPLQSWLSSGDTIDIDAMQGPTTVSALIHAATMVKAGVYLVARFTPAWNEKVFYVLLMVLAGISCVGAAFGALVTTDLKRVLAYSTISQLSYMFLALSMREGEVGLSAGELHLFSHAIFKALLFLSAGAIIHSVAEERDIKKMGGLRTELPWIYWFMLIGVLGLMGIPFITNGGYSKELIIGTALENGYWFVFVITVLTALLTALYSTRMFLMIFHGKNRGAHVHKPKWIMRTTLGILAFLVVFTGFTVEGVFSDFLENNEKSFGNPFHINGAALGSALGAVVLGIVIAYLLYGKGQTEVAIFEQNKVLRALRTFVAEGFYIDHLYNLVIVKPAFWIGKQLSYLKTGKINWNMIFGSLVSIGVLVITVVIV
ncbi:MAG: NADH-quinone oxidoreductase subunit L [Candidatus Heimdallarchaeum endolithica]|uniref:NADH-quinone oxidoreductase subunit L n=1 Tax=Candidatus Heimdallarchaeum endolithica TaxID=2876572 RepID=A0A9Y1BQ45_9ARCH|nr:MAG: NADH-quinone oxidoreductase subunit L [Candidatus Heimdallarchaeum endolithica]